MVTLMSTNKNKGKKDMANMGIKEEIQEEVEKELRSKAADWQKKKNEEFITKLEEEKKIQEEEKKIEEIFLRNL